MLTLIRTSSGDIPPVLGNDSRVRIGLSSVTQQPGEMFAAKALMAHEAEALFQVLQCLVDSDDQVSGLVAFIRAIDPLKDDGWDVSQMEVYIASAKASLSHPRWLIKVFEDLHYAQVQVAKNTGLRLFRTSFLKAIIAFYITGLPPDEVELMRSGSDAQLG